MLLALSLAACSDAKIDLSDNAARPFDRAAHQAPCTDSNPLRNAYFGDLHVHSSYSSDAYMWRVRLTPQDAYRYAFGESVLLPPLDESGQTGTRSVHIDRPLDFAAVTDHSEFLAEGLFCTEPEANPEVYASDFCVDYRQDVGRSIKLALRIFSPFSWRSAEVCGESGEDCKRGAQTIWQRTIQAAEDWDDSSAACERSTFVAYEYTSHRMGSNLHRNVIFRSTTVPPNPITYVEASREWLLWQKLQEDCLEAGNGCDVLAIPHNSNISNGRMFAVDYPGARTPEAQAARAALRARVEPIIEIYQHKGDSECRNGVSGILGGDDELCDFEKFENLAFETNHGTVDVEECGEGRWADWTPHKGPSCLSPLSYARFALIEGLAEAERIGVNPFKFGITASTDTHNALAGGVEEKTFAGHLGIGDDTPQKRATWSGEVGGNTSNSPGGLIGIWAGHNSRDALFDAMTRREVFGTSGPRIQPRFFGGWRYGESLCEDPELLATAYADGVPMGSDLPEREGDTSPVFLAAALSDAGTTANPGTPLQRLQVVKGWVDGDGNRQQRVYDVAGDAENGAAVDLDTCSQRGSGFAQLCQVWRDPEFDPNRRAVYYLRAVENPSCRYSAWQCLEMPEAERPADCQLPQARRAIQERAWSSPIWYTPGS